MKILPEFSPDRGTGTTELTKGWEQAAPGLLYMRPQHLPLKVKEKRYRQRF
jgi:hypothetical protein